MERSGTLILCYHRVAREVQDPFGLCVTPEHFAAHLDELLRNFEPSTLGSVRAPSRKRRVVVTFDDGYADNLWNALPIARAKGVPITVFVTSGMIDDPHGMWWDRLAAVMRARPASVKELQLSLAGGEVRVPLVGSPGDATDLSSVRSHVLALPTVEIGRAIEQISERWSVSSDAPADARTVTSAELVELASDDVVTIGAHTVDHLRLNGHPYTEQLRVVADSKAELERRLGRSVDHFAYPFGDFEETSVDAVREAGFETACTSLPGAVHPPTDALRLPRRVTADWGRLRFRAQLVRWNLW